MAFTAGEILECAARWGIDLSTGNDLAEGWTSNPSLDVTPPLTPNQSVYDTAYEIGQTTGLTELPNP